MRIHNGVTITVPRSLGRLGVASGVECRVLIGLQGLRGQALASPCLPPTAQFRGRDLARRCRRSSAYLRAAFFALNSAHRFLVASAMCLRPAALIFRFFVAGCLAGSPGLIALTAAHRFRCAAAIRLFVAELTTRLMRVPGTPVAVGVVLLNPAVFPPSSRRISAIFASIWSRWCWYPISAAWSRDWSALIWGKSITGGLEPKPQAQPRPVIDSHPWARTI